MAVEISDWSDLDAVRDNLTGDYVLVNDLDSETADYTGIGDDFEPIGLVEGDFDDSFEGSLNGDGFGIFDLVIDKDSGSGYGLITTVGDDSLVENLSVSGVISVSTDDFTHAGLAGEVTGTVRNCASFVDVEAPGTDTNGGLVGRNRSGGLIEDCYAAGSVTGDTDIGGLVGENFETVRNCYAVGSVTADESPGGLVGDDSNGTVIDSYWDTEATGQDTSDGGTGLTTAEMQGSEAETNMDGFDFAGAWDLVLESDNDATADGYPTLSALDREDQLRAQGILVPINVTVETNPATDVSEFSATLNGELVEIDDEAEEADMFFDFGESVDDSQTQTQTLTEPAAVDEMIDGISNDTQFEFRIVAEAEDADGEVYRFNGDILTFTTNATSIDIQTDAVVDVGAFGATLNGEVVDTGAYDSAETFFEFGLEAVDDESTDVVTVGEEDTLSAVARPFASDTAGIEYRAVAIGVNDGVRYEGDTLTFSTDTATVSGTINPTDPSEGAVVDVRNKTKNESYGRDRTGGGGEYSLNSISGAEVGDMLEILVDVKMEGETNASRAIYPTFGVEPPNE